MLIRPLLLKFVRGRRQTTVLSNTLIVATLSLWLDMIELRFAGTQLLSTTMSVKEYVRTEFQKLEQETILPNEQLFPSPITLDDFFWAFGILRSRAFSRLRGQNLVLIPLADFVSS